MKRVLLECVEDLESDHSTRAACALTGMARATVYRRRRSTTGHPSTKAGSAPKPAVKRRQPSALSDEERERIIEYATGAEFVDKSPHQMFYALLERGVYLGSERTIYRVLAAQNLVGDRRPHVNHPPRVMPHLHATAPGQVASWDITALATPWRGRYFYAYVMLDLFSRFMPATSVHETQSEHHATAFIECCITGFGGVVPGVIHSDNGAPMIAGSMTDLYRTLGVTRSLSRPRTSNDNPYSEAAFKTIKYAPAYPDAFESIVDAQSYFDDFRVYYNNAHYHSGLNYYTPASIYNGTWRAMQRRRQETLDAAYRAHPHRFTTPPTAAAPPAEAWINRPASTITTTTPGGPAH